MTLVPTLAAPLLMALIASDGDSSDKPAFATPILIAEPARAPIAKLLYPTPVLDDIDKDGVQEMVLGDLIGNIWVCEKLEGEIMEWSAPKAFESDGKPLKFDNW